VSATSCEEEQGQRGRAGNDDDDNNNTDRQRTVSAKEAGNTFAATT
jgi:hypothetical protein